MTTTQPRTQTQPRVDFFTDAPWRTILDLAMGIADRKVATCKDSPEHVIDQLRSLVASVKPAEKDGDAAKKALWGQFTHFVKNGSRDNLFTTGDGRDTGNLVHSLILGYRDWNLEAFKDVSKFVGGQWKFDANVFPGLIERAKAKFAELKGVDRLQAMRDLQPKIDQLVEFIEKQNAKRTRRETGDAAKSAAAGLQTERDGKPAAMPTTDALEVEPMADAMEEPLDEQTLAVLRATGLRGMIDVIYAQADELRAKGDRKAATVKEVEAIPLEAELADIRVTLDERERVAEAARVERARLVAEEAERARAAEAAKPLVVSRVEPVVAAVQSEPVRQTVIEQVRESFGIAGVASSDDPMEQIVAAADMAKLIMVADKGNARANSILDALASGKHTLESAVSAARLLGIIK